MKRAYKLRGIEKQPLGVTGSPYRNKAIRIAQATDVRRVSDLFEFVKKNDKDFRPNSVYRAINDIKTDCS